VLPVAAGDVGAARKLAGDLSLTLLPPGSDPAECPSADAVIRLDGDRLAVQRTGRSVPGPVEVDFGAPAMRHRRGAGGGELLSRALGVSPRRAGRVVDATAGLGRDAFVLADLGCEVLLCERHPVIAALLASGLERAADPGDPWLAGVVPRMSLWPGDARAVPSTAVDGAHGIYLDPMFPPRSKRAKVKKEMAFFQFLLEADGAAGEPVDLLRWALGRDVARVVVKRPPRAQALGDRPPSHCIEGKAVRYDVYVLRGRD